MSVVLAATWNPRGELPRALRMIDDLTILYTALVIVTPLEAESAVSALAEHPAVTLTPGTHGPNRRHSAVQNALASGPDVAAIHSCDFDRLLHWLECFPDELRQAIQQMTRTDCLITGRTEQAWDTHPRCMFETETLFNMAFSQVLKLDNVPPMIDFGAGSRGLSQRAAEYLMAHAVSDWGWAVDAAWPLLLHRAGYTVEYLAVDGLEWETPDQFRDSAADPNTRAAVAAQHDQSPKTWQQRVHIAHEVLRVGLLAAEQTHHEETQTDG